MSLPSLAAIAALGVALAACSSEPSGSPGSASNASSSSSAGRAAGVVAPRPEATARPKADLAHAHPFSVQDMVRMERVGSPTPSPDGKWVVFTRQAWDPDANQKTTNLWLVTADGTTTRPLTTAVGVADGGPVWAPDSKSIFFTSSRDGGGKAWVIRVDGGEARPFLKLAIDVDNLRMSPTGAHLAFSAEIYPDSSTGKEIAETAKRDAEKAKRPSKARTYDKLMVRHWDSWSEGKRNHVFVVPLTWDADGNATLGGDPLDLMSGVDGDCPTRPFGGTEDFVFAPDGSELAYVAQLGDDQAWSTNLDVFTVPVKGGPATCVTEGNRATDRGPAYSPDGSTLAWLAMSRPGFEADRLVIQLHDRASGATRPLAANWDRSVSAITWLPNSRGLIATAEERARQRVFAVDTASGNALPLLTEHWNDAVSILPAHGNEPARLVFTNDGFTSPAEVYRSDIDGSSRLRLTRVNDARVALMQMSEAEEFGFKGWNDEPVQAWLVKPVGFQVGKKYPLAFVIHGGPQGAIGDHFHYRWNLNAFAGAGYAVVAVNFHGSTGFGQAFTDAISQDWGGKPFEDLMKGLDSALAKYPWIDPDRICLLYTSPSPRDS